jgi:hypothetical protein
MVPYLSPCAGEMSQVTGSPPEYLALSQGIQEIGGAIKFGHLNISSANFIQSMGIAASAGCLALFFG